MGGVKGWPPGPSRGDRWDALRIDFGRPEDRLERLEWDRFFEIFDDSGIKFLYDPEGHMNKFVRDE